MKKIELFGLVDDKGKEYKLSFGGVYVVRRLEKGQSWWNVLFRPKYKEYRFDLCEVKPINKD